MPCLCASWGGGILAYSKSFATFNTHKEFNIIQGKIPNKNNGDVTLAVKLDGEKYKEVGFPSKEGHKFKGYECTKGGVLTWNKETWKATLSEIDKPTVCILEFETVNGENFVTYLKETNELTTFNHEATDQTPALTDYRYTGVNPNNYVEFNCVENNNCELWRIIGVFNIDDGTGKYEERVKLIRATGIGGIGWDTNQINDWTNASLKTLLNSGDYYTRSGLYTNIGLSESAKILISDAKWYLGGQSWNQGVKATANDFYNYERSNNVQINNKINWLGEVGLIYPSDYGYTTSVGPSEPTLFGRYVGLQALQSWLIDGNFSSADTREERDEKANTWFLNPPINSSSSAYNMSYDSFFFGDVTVNTQWNVRPSVYLQPEVFVYGGHGSKDTPYIIK